MLPKRSSGGNSGHDRFSGFPVCRHGRGKIRDLFFLFITRNSFRRACPDVVEKSHRGTNRSLNRRNRSERPARRTEDRKKGRFQSRPFLLPPSQGSSLSRFPAVFGLFHSHFLLSSSSSSPDRRLPDPWTLSVNVPSSMTSDCRKIFFLRKKVGSGWPISVVV